MPRTHARDTHTDQRIHTHRTFMLDTYVYDVHTERMTRTALRITATLAMGTALTLGMGTTGTAQAVSSTDTASHLSTFCDPHTIDSVGIVAWNSYIARGWTAAPNGTPTGNPSILMHPTCY